MNTYYINDDRGFANEYDVAVATRPETRKNFSEENGWRRLSRSEAIKAARYKGDAATQAYVGYRVDDPTESAYPDDWFAAVFG